MSSPTLLLLPDAIQLKIPFLLLEIKIRQDISSGRFLYQNKTLEQYMHHKMQLMTKVLVSRMEILLLIQYFEELVIVDITASNISSFFLEILNYINFIIFL